MTNTDDREWFGGYNARHPECLICGRRGCAEASCTDTEECVHAKPLTTFHGEYVHMGACEKVWRESAEEVERGTVLHKVAS